ncbi:3-oxoadipyl-CoA thiolase [Sphingopyxis granuli]|uniref:acetyl-CoA C-acyltransferase n=2 Tax=Sphingopyxis TaxID=165697 RepID=D9PTN1_SPHMC|nr:3-oxoadipyl-CoA thiolase [Sphingopyxis granuli]ADK93991.1 acetyl-CoA acteyl transferase-like protein [Sphingopyxis macrogoltabida]AMG75141.1 Acetyl-CoA acteyl transferase-like protein [Sphingopyxis granuli]
MLDAYIYDGIRSPIGRYGGKLASVRPDDLAAKVVRELVARSSFDGAQVEDVIMGNVTQSGEDSRNVARHIALAAGLPVEAAGQTVNRLCGSGLAAVLDAARTVRCGEGELFVAGGVESMSRAPFVMGKAESAYSRAAKIYDTTIGSRFPNPAITDPYGNDSMPETADNVARELDLTREDGDLFACNSQAKYARAKAAGFYDEEILPIEVSTGRKTPPVAVADDEHPRADTELAKLTSLRPLFEGGVVTAGNASGINDGAAALLIGSTAIGERAGARPLARIVAGAVAGVPPRIMGLGPVPATRKVLERAGIRLADLDVIEINEAFAVQVLGCCQQLGLAGDDERLNPNGGGIALGHPLGCSGARLALTATRQLHRVGGRYALVTMCIGVGQGIAAIIERVEA